MVESGRGLRAVQDACAVLGASAPVTVSVGGPPGSPAMTGEFDIESGALSLEAETVVIDVGSALELSGTSVSFLFGDDQPESGTVLATIQSGTATAPELKDAAGHPWQVHMDPAGD